MLSVCASLIWQGTVKLISRVVVSVCTLTSRKWDIMLLYILVIYWFVRFFGFGNIMDEKYLSCVLNHFSYVRFFVTPWSVALQAPLFLGFSRQESWSGLPFLSPGNLPDPGIEPGSLALQADLLLFEPPRKLYNTKNYSPKVTKYRISNCCEESNS